MVLNQSKTPARCQQHPPPLSYALSHTAQCPQSPQISEDWVTPVKLCLAVTLLQLESPPILMLPDHQQLSQRTPKLCYTSTTLVPQTTATLGAMNHQLEHILLSSAGCKETSMLKNIKMRGFGLFGCCVWFIFPEQVS